MGCHFFLQGIFPTQGLNLSLLCWQADSLLLSHKEALTLLLFSQVPQIQTLSWLSYLPNLVSYQVLRTLLLQCHLYLSLPLTPSQFRLMTAWFRTMITPSIPDWLPTQSPFPSLIMNVTSRIKAPKLALFLSIPNQPHTIHPADHVWSWSSMPWPQCVFPHPCRPLPTIPRRFTLIKSIYFSNLPITSLLLSYFFFPTSNPTSPTKAPDHSYGGLGRGTKRENLRRFLEKRGTGVGGTLHLVSIPPNFIKQLLWEEGTGGAKEASKLPTAEPRSDI